MPFIYPFINLYSKTTTENRYSTNITYPDHKYNTIRRLVSRYEELREPKMCKHALVQPRPRWGSS